MFSRRESKQPRRLLIWVGVVLVLILAFPAWQRARSYYYLDAAHRALRESEPRLAIEYVQRLDPERSDVQFLTGVAYRRLGELDAAVKHLEKAEALGHSFEEIILQRYMARFQAGDIKGTENYLKQILIEGTDDDTAEQVYECIARGFLSEFRIHDARVCLDHWIEWKPDAMQPRIWRAELFAQDSNWSEAAKDYEQILNYHPGHRKARHGLADALLADNRVEQASSHYQRLLETGPTDVMAALGLAHCERRLGKLASARKRLDAALAQPMEESLRGYALGERGQVALVEKQFEEAVRDLEKSLVIEPGDSTIHYSLAMAYSHLGQKDRAEVHLTGSREILEKHSRIKALGDELAAHPENADLRCEMAQVLWDLGREEEAGRWLATALHADATHGLSHQLGAEMSRSRDSRRNAGQQRLLGERQVKALTAPRQTSAGVDTP